MQFDPSAASRRSQLSRSKQGKATSLHHIGVAQWAGPTVKNPASLLILIIHIHRYQPSFFCFRQGQWFQWRQIGNRKTLDLVLLVAPVAEHAVFDNPVVLDSDKSWRPVRAERADIGMMFLFVDLTCLKNLYQVL